MVECRRSTKGAVRETRGKGADLLCTCTGSGGVRERLVQPDNDEGDCHRANQLRCNKDDLDSAADNGAGVDNYHDAIASIRRLDKRDRPARGMPWSVTTREADTHDGLQWPVWVGERAGPGRT